MRDRWATIPEMQESTHGKTDNFVFSKDIQQILAITIRLGNH
jgi:hypothetical protein